MKTIDQANSTGELQMLAMETLVALNDWQREQDHEVVERLDCQIEWDSGNPQKSSINMATIEFTEREKNYGHSFLIRLLANALGVNSLDITEIKFDHLAKSDIEFVILQDGKRSRRKRFQGSFEINNAIFSIDFCKVPLNPNN